MYLNWAKTVHYTLATIWNTWVCGMENLHHQLLLLLSNCALLLFQGCTKSFHSNVAPKQPEKPVVDKSKVDEVIEYRAPKPITESTGTRPPLDSPLVSLQLKSGASETNWLNTNKELFVDLIAENYGQIFLFIKNENFFLFLLLNKVRFKGCKIWLE